MQIIANILQSILSVISQPKPLRKYSLDFTPYQKTQQAKTDCNSFQVINVGTSSLRINNALTLITGQTFTSEGNENEIITDAITITFDNLGTNNCVVVRKTYS